MEGVPFANWDLYHSETYENAESYQTGDFSGNADEVQTLAVYWRSGEIKITESEGDSIEIRESGKKSDRGCKMHYYLKDGQLEVRFCASGATIQVKPKEKHLQIEVPKKHAVVHSQYIRGCESKTFRAGANISGNHVG